MTRLVKDRDNCSGVYSKDRSSELKFVVDSDKELACWEAVYSGESGGSPSGYVSKFGVRMVVLNIMCMASKILFQIPK